jgi:DNA-binding response OmpR family regulator
VLAAAPRERGSILLLEADAAVREALVDALTRAGHGVRAAGEGDVGLAELAGERFDVVIAGLALPRRSGLVAASAVKRLHPRTPVILIADWAHPLDAERLRQHGVDLVLVKPFRPERAVALVSDALRLGAPA